MINGCTLTVIKRANLVFEVLSDSTIVVRSKIVFVCSSFSAYNIHFYKLTMIILFVVDEIGNLADVSTIVGPH